MDISLQLFLNDKRISTFIMTYIICDAVNIFMLRIANFSGMVLHVGKSLISVFILLTLMNAIIRRKKYLSEYLLLGGIIIIPFLYSYVVGVEWSDLTNWIQFTITVSAPMMYLIYNMYDIEVLYQTLKKYIWLPTILLLCYLLLTWTGVEHNLTVSYALLLPSLFYANEFFNKNGKIYLVVSLFIVGCIFVAGSRGTIVCILSFFMYKIITVDAKKSLKMIIVFLMILFSGVTYVFFDRIMVFITGYLSTKGVYSRSLSLLQIGEFTQASSRTVLWKNVIELIKQKPLFGWGLRGAIEEMGYPYPHQFFFDPPLAFGVPVGVVIICCVLFWIYKGFKSTDKIVKDLMAIFFCCGFVPLMFSVTMFHHFNFNILIGVSLYSVKSTKNQWYQLQDKYHE